MCEPPPPPHTTFRYLGQKEKELDKKNTELANAQLSKESLTRDLQQKQMDLSIQVLSLSAPNCARDRYNMDRFILVWVGGWVGDSERPR